MTLKEAADRITANEGREVDIPFERRVKSALISARATLIRREFSKLKDFPDYAITEIGCIPMKTADLNDCCESKLRCLPVKTVNPLPELIFVNNRFAPFKFVGSNSGLTPFSYILPEEIPYIRESMFSKDLPRYTYINNHIYIFNSIATIIKVRAPFSNPLDLIGLTDCNGSSCFNEDSSVFIENFLFDTIKDLVYNELQIGNRDYPLPKDKEAEVKANE